MCSANSQAHLERAPHPVVRADSATRLPADSRGAVLVLGSHAAVHAVALAAQGGAVASLHHDAGPGRDAAGIAGLAWADGFGMAVAAVAASSARIGDAADVQARGIVSAVNATAAKLGIVPGQTAADALERLRRAPSPLPAPPPEADARFEIDGVVCVDSIALLIPADAGRIVAAGSHGARAACRYAVAIAPGLAMFNDAGGAADGSGVGGVEMLGGLGTAAIAVSAASARIGSARSTLLDGIVSFVNAPAAARGIRIGEKAASLAARLLS